MTTKNTAPTAQESTASVILQERLRIAAIIECSDGLTRPEMARQLALRSNMGATEAVELLKTVPASSPFEGAMNAFAGTLPGNLNAPPPSLDPRSARLAEIQQVGRIFNESRGSTTKAGA